MVSELLQSNENFFIFVYGISFIVIGFAIVFKRREIAHFDLTDSFAFLAAFGFLHGFSDLLPLAASIKSLTLQQVKWLSVVKLVTAVISFQFLVYFAFVELAEPKNRLKYFLISLPFGVAINYTVSVNSISNINMAFLVSSYLLGLPSCLFAAASFYRLSTRFRSIGMPLLGQDFAMLGVIFLSYGLLKVWPVYTSFSVVQASGIPVLMLRSLTALIGAFFIVRVLGNFKV